MNHTLSRRHFLALAAGVLVQTPNERRAPDMVVRSARPEDLEMPLAGFLDDITPIERFFVRAHTYTPRIDVNVWRLQVSGDVDTPLTMTLDDIRRLPGVELVGVLECAGNGRSFYEPPVPGVQWSTGAVGNGVWRGVRLADVLERAGVRRSAREVLFNGADAPIGTMPDFERSIPLAKALDRNTLLAYEMNGETLPLKHGYPLRVVAPGWAGDSWIKWLSSISVIDREHDGFWMARAYRHPGRPVRPGTALPPAQMEPVTTLRVKSVIAAPLDGSEVIVGRPVSIRGAAWGGDAGPVTDVEVSVDGGRTWSAARMRSRRSTRFGWRQWEHTWTPRREGYYTVLARARDSAGNRQPLEQEWNQSGYLWNVVPRVSVDVVSRLSETSRTAALQGSAAMPPDAYRTSCALCHGEDIVRQQRLTRAQWDAEIEKMIGWGAKVSAGDRAALLDYLSSNYGPGPR
jgi:DMSO/TMAO reductase YedYZ molybdopterin-dependent catalytic subunit